MLLKMGCFSDGRMLKFKSKFEREVNMVIYIDFSLLLAFLNYGKYFLKIWRANFLI